MSLENLLFGVRIYTTVPEYELFHHANLSEKTWIPYWITIFTFFSYLSTAKVNKKENEYDQERNSKFVI